MSLSSYPCTICFFKWDLVYRQKRPNTIGTHVFFKWDLVYRQKRPNTIGTRAQLVCRRTPYKVCTKWQKRPNTWAKKTFYYRWHTWKWTNLLSANTVVGLFWHCSRSLLTLCWHTWKWTNLRTSGRRIKTWCTNSSTLWGGYMWGGGYMYYGG